MSELRGGISLLVIGAPGTGKSTLLGSITEVKGVKNALLLAPKPREVNSYKYRENGITDTAEVFKDHKWHPAIGLYEAGAFTRLYQRVLSLYEDTTLDAVIVDPLTDVVGLAAHELMAVEKSETPKDLRDSRAFYGALKYKLKNFIQALVGLSSPDLAHPKHVLVAIHAQPTGEDEDGKGIEFLGTALPMIEGGYRREIQGEFDLVGFTNVKHELVKNPKTGKTERASVFKVQLGADPTKHAKIALVASLEEKEVPNHMNEVFGLIR